MTATDELRRMLDERGVDGGVFDARLRREAAERGAEVDG